METPAARAASGNDKTTFIASVVRAAQSAQRRFGVPASVSIAQAIEASSWGTSTVAKKARNYFNTACSGSMTVSQYAELADSQVGKPYLLGANGPTEFDCSSLVIWLNNSSGAFRMGDDTAAGLYNRSRPVSGPPRVGDMVFLRNNPARSNGIGHMAVLTKELSSGEWRIIEARGRAYGVVRSTLSYWKQRSYYAGLRRLATIAFASTGGAATSASRLYQSGCVTVGSRSYASFSSTTNSFYANAAAITTDPAFAKARPVATRIPAFVDALAKAVKPNDPDTYARTLNSLIDTYSLTDYDLVPISILLKAGSRGVKVTALQHLLQAAGYKVAITGTFDAATESAVRKLQIAKKVEADGEAGRITLSALFARLGAGATGPRTSAVHALLGALGFTAPPGSSFGPDTVASVRAFQEAAGRSVTGSVDDQTWAALFMTLDSTRPTVSGNPEVGQTLTGGTGAWGPRSVSLAFQWYRGSSPISGATENRYEVQSDDVGSALRLVVTGFKTGWTVTARASVPTAPVREARFTSTPTPTITGTARVDGTLEATPGAWAPGEVLLDFQWNRDGKAIRGGTNARYVAQPDDVGAALTVTVTGSRPGFATVARTSAATPPVAKADFTAAARPKIAGTPKVGRTLTALAGEWEPGPVSYGYQWYRGSARIRGASGRTYSVRAADSNNTLYVTVTGFRDGYRTVVKKSAGVRIP